jgi:4-hydroxy-2-oxoglutarate aldolase
MKNGLTPHGVYVSLVTPFRDNEVAYDLLKENIRLLQQTDVSGFLVLGGNAETHGMNSYEKLEIIKLVRQNTSKKQLIVGVSADSSRLAIEEIEKLDKSLVDYVRVLPPHYFAKSMTQDILYRFYNEVADAAKLPIILYHVPRLTNGVEFSADLVKKLAQHQNIVGIKDSSPDGIYGFIASTSEFKDFAVLAGSANTFYPALVSGAAGGNMTVANYLPKMCCDLYDCFKEGNLEKARQLYFTLYTINKYVSGKLGIGGIKAAMTILGFQGGDPRSPISALDDKAKADLKIKLEVMLNEFN